MEQNICSKWVTLLRQSGMGGIALTVLEGSGPVRLLFSQLLQGIIPLFDQRSDSSWRKFAEMMEDPTESQRFADQLRQDLSI